MAGPDEFGLIEKLFLPLTAGAPQALGLQDDVALISAGGVLAWALTTDAIVAGVHFFADDPPELIARKLIRVNLSDLAAKGALPRFLLLSACFPRAITMDWLDRFAGGLKSDCDQFNLAVIGGDTVATPGPLTLSMTAIGEVAFSDALLRSNARSGDIVWVSGTLGDAALGLLVAKGEITSLSDADSAFLLDRYHLPQPRLELGRALVGLAHAAMDLSDGLIGDLAHICRASGLGATVRVAELPMSDAARVAAGSGLDDLASYAYAGGDDYELLFTAPAEATPAVRAVAAASGVEVTAIGQMKPGNSVELIDRQGRPILARRHGYQHFQGPAQ